MTKKFKLYVILAFTPMIFLLSCSKFADKYLTSQDVHVHTTGNTAGLLTDALWNSFVYNYGNSVVYGNSQTAFYVQYITDAAYPSASLYNTLNNSWSIFYVNVLQNLNYIINYNTSTPTASNVVGNGSNKNQIASARIWKAYIYSILTDQYGDVPYSQALSASNITPVYDKQKDIYTDIFKELTAAVDQFDNGQALKGDILFNGDVTQWKKFANSLRMVLALRLSKIDPATGKAQFVAAMNHSAGYIQSAAETAYFTYLTDPNFKNPWNGIYNGNAISISKSFISLLQDPNIADPRLDSFVSVNTAGGIDGIDYGLNSTDISAWISSHPGGYSNIAASFRNYDSKGYFLTASEVLLARAEAGVLGWVSGTTPANDYNNAITLSFNQVGITDPTEINAYLANTGVAFGATTATQLQQIATQKYIALFPNSNEAYSEWRRTGYPKLTPAVDAVNQSKQIPRRFGYPLVEANYNPANKTDALNRMDGTNSTDNRVWWDVK